MTSQDTFVGYIHGDLIHQEFHHCLIAMMWFDATGPRRILDYRSEYSGSQLCSARNRLASSFLETGAEWFLSVDTDAVFTPNMVHLLLADADPDDFPIIGALAHRTGPLTHRQLIDGYGSYQREAVPVAHKQILDDDGEIIGYQELESYGQGLIEVDATGLHFLLIHRNVFEKTRADHPLPWFREEVSPHGILTGEDITFCLAARRAGFPIHIDTRLEAGHVKSLVITSAGRG